MSLIEAIKIEEGAQHYDQGRINQVNGPFLIQNTCNQTGKCLPKISEWSFMENAKYVAFIQQNSERMEGKPHGKLWGLYQEMAKVVETRNFRQCKLHHQKLTNTIGKISEISIHFITKYPEFQEALFEEK